VTPASLQRHRRIVHTISEHSLLLPIGAVTALIWANTAPGSYRTFAHALEFAVNDVGMVFFLRSRPRRSSKPPRPAACCHAARRGGAARGALQHVKLKSSPRVVH
jgi:hypothetical protein